MTRRPTPVPTSYPETEDDIHTRDTIPAPPPSDLDEADQAWSSDELDIVIDLDDPEVDIDIMFDSIQIPEPSAWAVEVAQKMLAEAQSEEEAPVSTERSRIARVADRCNAERLWDVELDDSDEIRRADYIIDQSKGDWS
jgi:hypothetical protein